MKKVRRHIAAAAAAAAFSTACSDADGAATRYSLTEVDGSPIPQVLRVEAGCMHSLAGGSVSFSGNGQYQSSYEIEIRCADESKSTTNRLGSSGTAQIIGDSVRFFIDSGETGRGILTSDSLIVRSPDRVLSYTRERS